MQCPTCGSTDVYRSKRDWFERVFNGLFWYHQRPFRCATCMTRYWIRLEPRVWRHAFKLRVNKLARAWGIYAGAFVLTILIAWILNVLHQKSQEALNPMLEDLARQNLKKEWEDLPADQKDTYQKEAENYGLSPQQKEEAKKLLGK